jgi:predicted protein tyrosine phosphatase
MKISNPKVLNIVLDKINYLELVLLMSVRNKEINLSVHCNYMQIKMIVCLNAPDIVLPDKEEMSMSVLLN